MTEKEILKQALKLLIDNYHSDEDNEKLQNLCENLEDYIDNLERE